eukprot:GEMP01034503.1.p1 GENE.GEMP01034503.1~~GEMP01034503.1.p1  ORF type:complete len:367 (+),score=83.71 GEMP01034503.1:47-1147(+)
MQYQSAALSSVTEAEIAAELRNENGSEAAQTPRSELRLADDERERSDFPDFLPDPHYQSFRTSVRKDAGEPWNERILDSYAAPGVYVGERVVEQHNVYGYKQYMTVEKIVEVPQVIVKERVSVEKKIEVQERIIEVPIVEIYETIVEVPHTKQVEKIVEVPQVVVEEKIIYETRIEVQERIIEVPKIIFEEVIEYEDTIEYREVPVDTYVDEIVEVYVMIPKPQEVLVPMYEYVEVPEYVDVPMVQMQEVERIEEVPVTEYVAVPVYKYVPVQQYRYVYPDGTMVPLDAPPPGYPPLQAPSVSEGLQPHPLLGPNPRILHANTSMNAPQANPMGAQFLPTREPPTPPRPRPTGENVPHLWKAVAAT